MSLQERLRRKWARKDFSYFNNKVTYPPPIFTSPPMHFEWEQLLQNAYGKHHRILLLAPRGAAKSERVTINYPSWMIGRNHELRISIVSTPQDKAISFLSKIATRIEEDKFYRSVFGNLKPISPKLWRTDAITVKREHISKDPSISAVGSMGQAVSKRADLVLVDDPLDSENTKTKYQRESMIKWFNDALDPILEPNGLMIAIMCLTGDTRILMRNKTYKRLEEISVGEKVWVFNKEKMAGEQQTVEAVVSQGIDEVYELKTKNHTIRANKGHPFLVLEDKPYIFRNKIYRDKKYNQNVNLKWKRLENIQIGDYIISYARNRWGGVTNTSSEEMWLLGYMFGDGWITHHPNKYGSMRWLTCVAKSVYPELNNKLLKLFKMLYNVDLIEDDKGYYRTEVAKVGRRLEELRFKGKAKTKRVPKYVYTLIPMLREGFLNGFLKADGHVAKNKLRHINLANKELLEDVKLLAQSLGYKVSNIFIEKKFFKPPHTKKAKWFTHYHISIGNKKYSTEFTISYVCSIKKVGKEEVFDLSISGTKSFIANNLVVHNTPWHEGDLSQYLMKQPGWVVMKYPAVMEPEKNFDLWLQTDDPKLTVWPKKYGYLVPLIDHNGKPILGEDGKPKTVSFLRSKYNANIDSFMSQYLLDPFSVTGTLFDLEWINYFTPDEFNLVKKNCLIYQGWDLAVTVKERSDYTACATVAFDGVTNHLYVLEVYRDKLNPLEQFDAVKRQFDRWSKVSPIQQVTIEADQYQESLAMGLIVATTLPVVASKSKGQRKIDRIGLLGPHFRNGRIKVANYMRDGEFEYEYKRFPKSEKNDQLDALQKACEPILGQSESGPMTIIDLSLRSQYDIKERVKTGV